jgi:hypothetical protein
MIVFGGGALAIEDNLFLTVCCAHKIDVCLAAAVCTFMSLEDLSSLPSATDTRQNLFYTRQMLCLVLHSAKRSRQRRDRQSVLPSAISRALGKNFA